MEDVGPIGEHCFSQLLSFFWRIFELFDLFELNLLGHFPVNLFAPTNTLPAYNVQDGAVQGVGRFHI